jgi:small subunit ribosomal protein S8
MSMSDPIADLLTRLRNGIQARQDSVQVPTSRLKREILEVFKREGYIQDFEEKKDTGKGVLQVKLKYIDGQEPVIKNLKRVSKPSLRIYTKSQAMKPVRSGMGISIVTTSKGIMTGKQARQSNLGGEVICEIW